MQGQIYIAKPTDGPQQVIVGEQTVLKMVSLHKGSERNVTMDSFFVTMELAKVLKSWSMTLVGAIRKKAKGFCQATCSLTRLPEKGLFTPPLLPTIIMHQSVHMCLRRRKQSCFRHLRSCLEKLEETQSARTKGGVDTMDKMGEYTV